jgi:hypothetical protein
MKERCVCLISGLGRNRKDINPMVSLNENVTGRKHRDLSPLGRRVEIFALNYCTSFAG